MNSDPLHRVEIRIEIFSFFLSFFGSEDPSQFLGEADGEHPINHLGPKKLLRTRGQGASLFLEQTMRVPRQVGKTGHNIGGLACILWLTNSHNQSS